MLGEGHRYSAPLISATSPLRNDMLTDLNRRARDNQIQKARTLCPCLLLIGPQETTPMQSYCRGESDDFAPLAEK